MARTRIDAGTAAGAVEGGGEPLSQDAGRVVREGPPGRHFTPQMHAMAEYPKRPAFFAHRFTRLLAHVCAANDIGIAACYMLVQIAHCEDAKKYRGPVTYWGEQFQLILGLSRTDLWRARKRAVEAGWLHYEHGAKSRPARYWVLVPQRYAGMPDSELGADIPFQSETESADIPFQSETESGRNPGAIRAQSGTHSNPYPNPDPNPKKELTCGEHNHCESETERSWDRFWAACPLKVGKRKARMEWELAVKRLTSEEGMRVANARDWLCDRMEAFAASPVARTEFCPHPRTWLFQGRYHDDPETWRARNGRSIARVREDAPPESERV